MTIDGTYSPSLSQQSDYPDHDVSELMQSDEVVMNCLAMLAASVHLDTAIESFLETLCCFYGAAGTFLIHVRDDSSLASFVRPASGFLSDKLNSLSAFEDWHAAFESDGFLRLSAEDKRLTPLYSLCTIRPESVIAVPLYTDTSLTGILCTVDPVSHVPDMKVILAVANMSVVELRKLDLTAQLDYLRRKDPLTDTYNRSSYIDLLSNNCTPAPATMGVIIAGVNGLKAVNEALGYAFGDNIIQQTAETLKETLNTKIYRIGSNEFISFHPDIPLASFQEMTNALRSAFDSDPSYSVSIGAVWSDHNIDIHDLVFQATHQLSANKKNTVKSAP